MEQRLLKNTIAAIATAQVEGAISIVRLSGPEAVTIADMVYRGKQRLADVATHTINYGKIYNNKNGAQVDEVLVSVFRAPKTYTREDVVEINAHGGVAVTSEILRLVLANGARLAEPGEFTKRSFLNGRIDLTQAEAVADMIKAENNQAVHMAAAALDGKLAQQIKTFRADIVALLANIEVNIDYPEYDDVEMLTDTIILPKIDALITGMDKLLRTARTGQIIKDGIQTAIVGRPNVGKSSLLNALLREEKAIVTHIAGTTRDIVEGSIRLRDVTLRMIDTAGIRETEDIVEQIGITKAKDLLQKADLVLLVLDQGEVLSEEDKELLALVATKKAIIVRNKNDLPTRLELPEHYMELPQVAISAQHDIGLTDLYDALEAVLDLNLNATNQVYLANARHVTLLEAAREALDQAKTSAASGMPIDIITIDLQAAYSGLGEMLGVEIKDELLDTLFSNFCLGK